MVAKVVQLHEVSLQDIPAMLRRIAEQIEAGEHGDVATAFMILPVDGDYPRVFGWGDIEGKNDPVIQLELAKMWLLTNLIARS